jgi:superfamily II DNA or RNA helicase/HKD family nuclease
MFSHENLLDGVSSGLINLNPDISHYLQPHLVLNDADRGTKTLQFVLQNLESCNSFRFAIAFVTRSGVACIHQALKNFTERGGYGEILISKYLHFSDPHAISALKSFKNITVKFISAPNFHGKTLMFEHDEFVRVLIGSSNLTQDALGKNTEINISAAITRNSSLFIEIDGYFKGWSLASVEIDKLVFDEYFEAWSVARHRNQSVESKYSAIDLRHEDELPVAPNSMQKDALKNLSLVRENGKTRSLVVSATGTGKTVLSAFDVKQSKARRMLFIVHRLNIAKKAMSEFRKVFLDSKSMGLYSSSEDLNTTSDFIFTTVQTLNLDSHLNKFSPEDFDYIIIDETHRAGAKTYQKIIDYFKPKFLLGMTATPERTDDFDIFSLFNHSVAYEVRLQKALEAELLVPFHYFGIADITVDGCSLNDSSSFNHLISSQRVAHILDILKEYGCDSGLPKGLVFCSCVEEAKMLSQAFNNSGLKACSLTGEDSEAQRELAISRLESVGEDRLDYILTVDIFNEGIDIPSINQVVMLRPTTSAIIFVQQLGRGLRKSVGKNYLTVIDFIANYQNNYLIPVALFGDSSFNKDKLRNILSMGSGLIPGASSISFEPIAKQLIFNSINLTNLNTRLQLLEDYKLLKFRLGREPMMIDFLEHQSRDPYQFVNYERGGNSLMAFAVATGHLDYQPDEKIKLLGYLGKHVFDAKRLEDSAIVNLLKNSSETSFTNVKKFVFDAVGYEPSSETILSAIHSINLHYITERFNGKSWRVSELNSFDLVYVEGDRIIQSKFLAEIKESNTFSNYFFDLVNSSIKVFCENFQLSNYVDGFVRGRKYSRKDVFRILNWDKRPNEQNVGGYAVSSDGKNCAIFATYHKSENISDTTKYEDKFLNPAHLVYMSKSNRNLNSSDVLAILNQDNTEIRIPFFAKKNDDEGADFYYLGDLKSLPKKFVNTTMSSESNVSVVKMEFLLDKPVEYGLYKYITDSVII